MASIPIQRLRFFDHQLLGVAEFNDEQAYHIEMRQLHNRLLHTWGIADGLELRYAPDVQQLTVEEGTAIDAEGREVVLVQEQTVDLSGFVGKTVYVTIAYGEEKSAPVGDGVSAEYGRWVSSPRIERSETPPDNAGVQLVLGRVVVNDQGEAKTDDGDEKFRRRQAGSKAGDIQVKGVTLTGVGTPEEWPRLETTGRLASRLTGSLAVDSGVVVGGDLGVTGGATVAKSLGVGGPAQAKLHVQHTPQDATGNAFVIGPVDGSSVRMGYNTDSSWIQSNGGPLRINELGGDVHLAPGGTSNVGIGHASPTHRLHVLADDAVGLFESRGSMAYLRIATREGFDNRVEVANRPGGRLSLWTAGGGDVVNVTRDGRLGIGTEYPTHRFHVRADDPVALFESIGPQAYLRIASREGMDNRVELANRPGGRLALFVAGGGDALTISRDGAVGVGTENPSPGAKLHVAGDLVVEGEIRAATGVVPVGGGPGSGGGTSPWQPVNVGIGFQGSVGVGTLSPEGKLQVVNGAQNSNGNTLILGPTSSANLRMGYADDYSWIQSHGSRPLRINELGNDVLLNLGGGSVGVGTPAPQGRLHVAGDLVVDGQIRTPQGTLTPGGGGGPAGVPVAPLRLVAPDAPLHLEAPGDGVRMVFTHQGGQSNWDMGIGGGRTPGARDFWLGDGRAVHWTVQDGSGNMGVGTGSPQGRLHVAGDLVVDGVIRTPQGTVTAGGGAPGPDGGTSPWKVEADGFATATTPGVRVMGNLVTGPLTAGPAVGRIEASGPTAELTLMDRTQNAFGGQAGDRFVWYNHDRRIRLYTEQTGDLLSVDPKGNVGMGTGAPQGRLHVAGDLVVDGQIRTPQGQVLPGGGGAAPAPVAPLRLVAPDAPLTVEAPGDGVRMILTHQGGQSSWDMGLGGGRTPTQRDFWLGNGRSVVLTVQDATGNLGLGTNAPEAKLHVKGDVLVEGTIRTPQGPLSPGGGGGGGGTSPWEAAQGGISYQGGSVGIATGTPEAKLQVINAPQGSGGNTLILGPTNAPNLRLGYAADYSWIQSHGSKPLRINELGNDVSLTLNGGHVGVGTAAPEAKLQVINQPQDSGGNTLILGPTNAANLRMGYAPDYSWIQSHGSKPLRINELGNDVLVALGGSNVGVGTPTPQAKLHVKGDLFVEGNVRTPTGVLGAGGGTSPWAGIPGGIMYRDGRVAIGTDKVPQQLTITDGIGFANQNANDKKLWSPADGMLRWQTHNQAGEHSFEVGHQGDPAAVRLSTQGNSWLLGGNVGIGTNAPSHVLHVKADGAVGLFESTADTAFLRVSAKDGTDNRVEVCNRGGGRLALWVAGAGDAFNILKDGKVGVGTPAPTHTFHVKADGAVGLFESSSNNAFLRVSTNDGIDNRVELCNRGGGRLALWVAGGSDAFNILKDGKVGVGTTTPQSSFHSRTQVTAGPYSFGPAEGRIEANGPIAEISFGRRDLPAPRNQPQPGDRFVWYNPDGNACLWTEGGAGNIVTVTKQGDMEVNNLRIRSGAKPGYVYDHFVNMAGDEVEQGDVVIIGEGDATRFWATGNTIPIPEVDLCERAYDTRVCGIVDSVTRADDLPHAEAQEAAKGKRGKKKAADEAGHPLQDLAANGESAGSAVGEGQLGRMVTLGAYAFCKVDADIAPIQAGDLLTTSPTKGHAQKAMDRTQASGAIIGKALASLAKGKGKIPVMVLMQ
jgi:hypothetical protein